MATKTKTKKNSYLSNVLKSIKYATIENVADMNPVIVETYRANKDFFKETLEELNEKQSKMLGTKNIKNIISDSYSNMKDDLRTGKFYNKERAEKANNEAMNEMFDIDIDAMFDAFDEDSDWGDDESDDNYSEQQPQTVPYDPMMKVMVNKNVAGTTHAINNATAKTTATLGGILIENSRLNANVIHSSTQQIMAGINTSTGLVHKDLSALNQNIAGIVSFTNEALRTHIENSTTFYETQKQQMQEQTDILNNILELQKKISTKEEKYSDKTTISDIFTTSGGFDLKEYKKYLSENKSAGYGGLLAQSIPMFLADIKGSPLSIPLKWGVNKALKPTKTSFESINNTVSGLISTSLLNLTDAKRGKNGGFFKILGDALGLKVPELKKMNLGSYNKDVVGWNGKDHKALTEVIPKYLSDIYSAVSGKEGTRFDYNTGKFVKIKDIQKKYETNLESNVRLANFSINQELNKQIQKVQWSNQKEKEEIIDTLEKIQKYNFQHMKKFNPNSKRAEDLDPKTYSITGANSDKKMEIARALYNSLDKKTQMQGSTEFLEAISMYNKELRRREAEGDNIFNTLFDDSLDDSKIIDTPIMASAKRLDETNSILKDILHKIETPKSTTSNTIYTGILTPDKYTTTNAGIIVPKDMSEPKKKEDQIDNNENGFKIGDNIDELEKMLSAPDPYAYLDEDNDKRKYTERIKDAKSASDKLKEFFRGFELLAKKPLTFMLGAVKKVDEYAYSLFFGEGEGDVKSVSQKLIKGFDNVFKKITHKVSDVFYSVKNEILSETKTTASSLFKAIFGVDIKQFTTDLKESLFGDSSVSFLSGMGKLMKTGMGEIYSDVKGSIKGFFKNDTTKSENGEDTTYRNIAADKLLAMYNKGKEKNKSDEDKIKEKKKNPFETIQNAARGLKVTKTGLVAVSEGERIIPDPDKMDPASISSRENAELTAMGKFKNALGLGDVDIDNFARGGKIGRKKKKKQKKMGNKYHPNMTYEEFNKFYSTLQTDEEKEKYTKKFAQDYAKKRVKEVRESGGKALIEVQKRVESFSNKIKDENPMLADMVQKETDKLFGSEFVKKIKSGTKKGVKGASDTVIGMKDTALNTFKNAMDDIKTSDDDFSVAFRELLSKFTPDVQSAKDVTADIKKNWKKYLPKTLASGALGAGFSLLTGMVGGPLLGAAVGAAVGLTSKSNAIQKMLFGDKITDDEGNVTGYTGNMLSKDISTAIQKYAPDMVKSGIGGMALSMMPFVPGGPITGLMVGGTLGYIKNNEEIQDILFGSKKAFSNVTKYVKKQLPAMGLGALTGMVAGPFGLTTNLILGSTLGLVSDTEKFKEMMFGYKGLDGKRKGGLVGIAKKILAPPLQGLNNLIDESTKFLKKDILNPLSKAVKPLFQSVENLFNRIADGITDAVSAHITKPIGHWLTDKIIVPIEKKLIMPILKAPFKLMKRVGRTAISPFLAVSRKIERGQLNKIGYGSGTAADRIVRRQELIDDYNEQTEGIFDPLAKIPGIGNTFLTRTGRRNLKSQAWQRQLNNSDSVKFDEYATNSNTTREELERALLLNKALGPAGIGKKKGIQNYATSVMKETGLNGVINNLKVDGKLPYKFGTAILKEVQTGKCEKSIKLINDSTPNMSEDERKQLIKLVEKATKDVQEGIKLAENAEEEAQKFIDEHGFDIRGNNVRRALEKELHTRGMTREEISEVIPESMRDDDDSPILDTNKKLDSIAEDVSEIANHYREIYEKNHKQEDAHENEQLDIGYANLYEGLMAQMQLGPDFADVAADASSGVSGTFRTVDLMQQMGMQQQPMEQYQYTENGIVRLTTNDRGELEVDEQDSETRETQRRRDEEQETQKGILGKLSGIGTSLLDFFSGDKDKEKKPSILSKILSVLGIGFSFLGGGKIMSALKIAAGAAVGSYVWGKLTKEDENGESIASKIGDKVQTAFGGVWDKISTWWSATAWPWITQDFFPTAMEGFSDIMANATNLLIQELPDIIVKGIAGIGKTIWNAVKKAIKGEEYMDEEDVTGDENGYKNGQDAESVNIQRSTNVEKNKVEKQYSTTTNDDGTTTTSRDISAEIKNSQAYKNIGYKDKADATATNQTIIDAWDKPTLIYDADGNPYTLGELANTPGVYLMDDANGKKLYSDDLFSSSSLLQTVTGNSTIEGADLGVESYKDTKEARDERTGTRASDHQNVLYKTADALIKDTLTGGKRSLGLLNGVTKVSNVAGNVLARVANKVPIIGTAASGVIKANTYSTAIPSAILNFKRGTTTALKSGTGVFGALKSGLSQAADTLPFSNRTRKVGGKVSSVIGKIGNGIKTLGSKATNKVMSATKITKTTGTLKDFEGNVVSSFTNYSADSKIGKLILKIKDAFEKIFTSNNLIDAIYKKVNKGVNKVTNIKEVTKDTIKKALQSCVDKLIDKLPSLIGDKIESLATKISAVVGTGGLSYAVSAAEGFIIGFKNADAIFEVGFGDVAMGERLIAGLLGVLEEFTFGIFDAHLLMSVFEKISELLGFKSEDLKERQEELEVIVSAYNDEYGTNFTAYDFIMDDKIETKIMKGVVKIAKTTGSGILTGLKGIGTGIYAVAGGVGNLFGSIFSDKYGWDNYTENLSKHAASTTEQAKKTVEYATKKNKNTQDYYNEYYEEKDASEETSEAVSKLEELSKSYATSTVAGITGTSYEDVASGNLLTDENNFGYQTLTEMSNGWMNLNDALSPLYTILNNNSDEIADMVSKALVVRLGLATADEDVTLEELLKDDKYLDARESLTMTDVNAAIEDVKYKKGITINVAPTSQSNVPLMSAGGSGSGITGIGLKTNEDPSESAFISQKKGKIANLTFGTGTNKQTVSDAGCAPVSAMMAINERTDKDSAMSINEALKTAGGYMASTGGVTADYFADEFGKHGYKTAYVPKNDKNQKKILLHQLSNGVSVVLMGKDESNSSKKKSPFGPTYHYVVATGLSSDGKYVFINDPESSTPNQKYPVETIFDNSDLSIIPIKTNGRIGSIKYNLKSKLQQYSGKATPGIIFVGDARTVGMKNAVGANNKRIFIAESGKGYIWMKNNIDRVKRASSQNPDYYIVFNMGLHDLGNISSYITYYKELRSSLIGNRVYFMSVNPIHEYKYKGSITNTRIKTFNEKYKAFAGDRYIDIYSWMMANGFEDSGDGMLYSSTQYTKIYNKVVSFFDSSSASTSTSTSSTDDTTTEETDDTSTTTDDSSSSTETVAGTTSTKKIKTIGDLISAIGSILSGAYGLSSSEAAELTGDTKTTFGGTSTINVDGISGTVSSDSAVAQKQKELVAKMKSVEGKLKYAQDNAKYPGSRNPDDGSGDCSSTVQWAYKNVTGKDIGDWTGAQEDSSATTHIDTPHMSRQFDESKMQLGDILLYGQNAQNHVEMYYGNGKMIGHGSGYGPKIKDISSRTSDPWSVKRLNEFMPGGKGTGLFVSQNDPQWANKTIGDEKVSVAGCAPAVATMAINNTKEYNMRQAIKDAEKYKSPEKGGVSAEYFIDTFKKQGYNTIVLKDKEKILNILAKGQYVVLIGKDENNKSKRRSPFGKGTHYVLATGVSANRDYIIINDPEQKEAEVKYKTDLVFKGVMLGIIPVTQDSSALNKLTASLKDSLSGINGKGETTLPTSTNPILIACGKMTRRLRSDKKGTWKYYSAGTKANNWSEALKNEDYRVNSSRFIVWALKEAGLLSQESQTFYAKSAKDDGWAWTDDVKKEVLSKCTLISINGAKSASNLAKSGELQPGDIVAYSDKNSYANIYAGNGDKWYDASSVYCEENKEGASYNDWYGTQADPGRVKSIIRYKYTATDSDTTSTDSATVAADSETWLDKLTKSFALLAEGWGLTSSSDDDTTTGVSTSTDSSSSTTVSGSNNKEKVWNYLKDKGIPEKGIAGFMGNVQAESEHDFCLIEGDLQHSEPSQIYTKQVDDGTVSREAFTNNQSPKSKWPVVNGKQYGPGYGLTQWTYYTRKEGLYDLAKQRNVSIADPQLQLDYNWTELQGYPSVLNAMKEASSVRNVSDVVLTQFERPADQSEAVKQKRAGYGEDIYKEFAGKGSGLSAIGIPKSSNSTIRSINRVNKGKSLSNNTPNMSIFGKGTTESGTVYTPSGTVRATGSNSSTPTYAYTANKSNTNSQVILANTSNNSSTDTTNTLLKAIVNLLSQEVKNTAFIEGIADAIVSLVDAKASSTEDVSTKKQLLDTKAQILSLVRQQNNESSSTSLGDLINSVESIIAQ